MFQSATHSLDRFLSQLKAGQTVLIQGGAGGVAGFGVQLAKHLGATVIATAKLADAAEAHRVSEARHLQGKLVLEVH